MEEHQSSRVNIVQRFKLGIVDAEAMKKANRVGEPGNIVVEEEWWDDEETSNMMDEERLLADAISSVHDILDGYFIDIENDCENEEESGEVIGPEVSFEIGVEEPVDAGDDEGRYEYDVAVDPNIVGVVVVIGPVDLL